MKAIVKSLKNIKMNVPRPVHVTPSQLLPLLPKSSAFRGPVFNVFPAPFRSIEDSIADLTLDEGVQTLVSLASDDVMTAISFGARCRLPEGRDRFDISFFAPGRDGAEFPCIAQAHLLEHLNIFDRQYTISKEGRTIIVTFDRCNNFERTMNTFSDHFDGKQDIIDFFLIDAGL